VKGRCGPSSNASPATSASAADVTFTGHLPQHEVWDQLEWADVLLHTGVIAPSGDRDGLPNVIPEAMSAGVLVVTSPAAATTEAITQGVTGFVAPVDVTDDWVGPAPPVDRRCLCGETARRGPPLGRGELRRPPECRAPARAVHARDRAMIFFDVTKAGGAGHRSGLMRVSARLAGRAARCARQRCGGRRGILRRLRGTIGF
jgi:hypothetical protein